MKLRFPAFAGLILSALVLLPAGVAIPIEPDDAPAEPDAAPPRSTRRTAELVGSPPGQAGDVPCTLPGQEDSA